MYKLFYSLKSAAMGIPVLLEEIGALYELIQTSVDMHTLRPPEQLAVNSNDWVSVLRWENGAMYEAASITMFLSDRHPEAQLAPAIDDPSRTVFCNLWSTFSTPYKILFSLPITLTDLLMHPRMSHVHRDAATRD